MGVFELFLGAFLGFVAIMLVLPFGVRFLLPLGNLYLRYVNYVMTGGDKW